MALFPNEMTLGKGRIEVILGPMFSGKTTELIRRITRFQYATLRCLVIKYAGDVRYSDTDIATHDSRTLSAVSCCQLSTHKPDAAGYDVIGIDEGQFFPDLIEFCEDLANDGKIILVAALDGTFQRTGFGDILNLIPLAESVVKLQAVCMKCYNNASYTKRISNEKAVEIIGGADKYMSVCRECYHSSDPLRSKPLKPIENVVLPLTKTPIKDQENRVTPPKRSHPSPGKCNGSKFSPPKKSLIEIL